MELLAREFFKVLLFDGRQTKVRRTTSLTTNEIDRIELAVGAIV
jgi:hypothetical protein